MVDCVQPSPDDTVVDPAAGTAGFLLTAHEYAARDAEQLTPKQRDHLRDGFVHGYELVDGTARLAAMNLLLHGIGSANGESLIEVKDALIADPGRRWSVVLSNPPFGRKSSLVMVGADEVEIADDDDDEEDEEDEDLEDEDEDDLDDDDEDEEDLDDDEDALDEEEDFDE